MTNYFPTFVLFLSPLGQMMNKRVIKKYLLSLILLSSLFGSVVLISQPASAVEVPQEITDAVEQAKKSIQAISGVSTVALAVGLSPLGAMLSLRFLNMILSRV